MDPTGAPGTPECTAADNNCSLVTQDGTGLLTTVLQTGSGNVSDVDQIDGSVGIPNNTGVGVFQSGSNATSYVLQSGVGSAVGQTLARVVQSGEGANSTIRQLGTAGSRTDVFQTGANMSYVEQDGSGQTLTRGTVAIEQSQGEGNTAVAFQQSGNSSIGNVLDGIVQLGDLNNAEVYQLAGGERLSARTIQIGDRNDIVIIQSNSGATGTGTAESVQVGDDNKSSVVQTGINGTGISAFAGRMVTIGQSGNDNLSRVEQENFRTGQLTSSLRVTQREDGNDSFIQQRSGSGVIDVSQNSSDMSGMVSGTDRDNPISGGTDSVRANFSRIIQEGTGRTLATLTQNGLGNLSDIRQNNAAALPSLADTSTVGVVQTGQNQSSFIEQNGTNDIAFVDQISGSGNFSYVDQQATGSGNRADIEQRGTNGQSTVTQSGSGDTANLLQAALSEGNISSIVQQGGSGNMANVNQYSNGNTSSVTQSGTAGMITVNQGIP
ncbi:hypothetical protein [Erythrobacter dokdonensis]|uniref:hypothetical protein n=1 Tax=Erythrobacter dokdonensis TaxID=328225 RepID=UPI001302ABAE|nr:hypothetical protein [Erythrobacter dokdonensis]